MKPEFEPLALIKNDDAHRFELHIEGAQAFIDFEENPTQIALVHTEVEPALEGKGAATAVIEKTLQYIEASQKTLLPYCPLVFAYIKKHPEWLRIVDEHFKSRF
ncbi:N-acetyltransferase [Ornithobacterium rhinotracheale]|uniref:N-acetyltransferase n=1 Tax=Ornithobacterium rhinotracheale TaxID=28251 RepID=A0A410JT84_ORNRH|nr:GNAT family N-acetyltransferase [Ornithobacterium rhinotracheale]QAR31255.1 N-acetyltransferase [Ornithobacterium rhinotracheale]